MKILLNDDTRKSIEHFIAHPGHALGIFGQNGSGKFFAAHYIAASILGTEAIENNPNLYIVRPDSKTSITIDQSREVVSFLKLKHGSKNTINRIVIIDDATSLTIQAQNALLKTLEEPPSDALIIMTATGPSSMLPTITSRLKTITLKPIPKRQIIDFFKDQKGTQELDKAYAISNGRLGLMSALLADDEHTLISAIEEAKRFLSLSQYDRLTQVDQILKSDVGQFLEALQLVSDSAFKQSILKGSTTQSKRWHFIRKHTADTTSSIKANAHAKLAITNLILKI